jgi:hypothetical protein
VVDAPGCRDRYPRHRNPRKKKACRRLPHADARSDNGRICISDDLVVVIFFVIIIIIVGIGGVTIIVVLLVFCLRSLLFFVSISIGPFFFFARFLVVFVRLFRSRPTLE